MKFWRLILLLLLLAMPNFARAQVFVFPNNPVVGQQVTGPGNVVYQWDGVKWVTVAPPASLPTNNPMFIGTLSGLNPGNVAGGATSVFTLPDTSTWNSVGGTIRAPILTGNGASRFTFETNRASISPTNQGLELGGGTTYDGSAWRAASGSASIFRAGRDGVFRFFGNTGLTANAAYSPTELASVSASAATFHVPVVLNQSIAYTDTFNLHGNLDNLIGVYVHNRNAGGMAQTGFNIRTVGNDTWFVMESSGYVNNGDLFQQPNTTGILAGGSNKFWFYDNAGRVDFWPNWRQNTTFDSYGLRLRQVGDPQRSQFFFDQTDGGVYASVASVHDDNLNMMAGGYYDNGTWWTNTGNAQLINWNNDNSMGFYVLHSLSGTAPWVRNAFIDNGGFYMSQTQGGDQYDFALTGPMVSWGRPWEGRAPLDAHPAQLWIGNGTCAPVSLNSGMLIMTENIYTGCSVLYWLGGGLVSNPASSRSGCPWATYQGCGPAGGNLSTCFSGDRYYVCNNIGADTIVGVAMLVTRGPP